MRVVHRGPSRFQELVIITDVTLLRCLFLFRITKTASRSLSKKIVYVHQTKWTSSRWESFPAKRFSIVVSLYLLARTIRLRSAFAFSTFVRTQFLTSDLLNLTIAVVSFNPKGFYLCIKMNPPDHPDCPFLDIETITPEKWRALMYNRIVQQKDVNQLL